MTLSPNEAADALRDIATVETHSRRAFGYRQASPHLILWGVLWVFGYGVTATRHALGGSIWAAVWVIGLAGDVAISRRSGRRVSSTAVMQSPVYWQFPAITLLVYAFVVATCAVMAPVSGRQIGAFVPLVIAAGCWGSGWDCALSRSARRLRC
jgi:hypothetical protein